MKPWSLTSLNQIIVPCIEPAFVGNLSTKVSPFFADPNAREQQSNQADEHPRRQVEVSGARRSERPERAGSHRGAEIAEALDRGQDPECGPSYLRRGER